MVKPKDSKPFLANTHGQPLAEHLFAVAYVAQELFKKSLGNSDELNLINVAFLAGCLHDLGKLDPLFQKWVKTGKQKNPDDDGQHIDGTFTFDKHPRHNEISLLLFIFFERQCAQLYPWEKTAIKHVVYWHHAKPYRKENNFNGVLDCYKYLSKNISSNELELLFQQSIDIVNQVEQISQNYCCKKFSIKHNLPWNIDSFKEMKADFLHTFENKNIEFPEFKDYCQIDDITDITNSIYVNAQHNTLRSCVISADRLVSSISATALLDFIREGRLIECLFDKVDLSSNLVSHLDNALARFSESERTIKQRLVAKNLAELKEIGILSGAAGCGKTKIALEWAKIKNAQKIIWICPRVQVCQGIFEELTSNYLPDAHIEIFTGEFKYTNSWDNQTAEKNYFSGDVVVTTIDQILGAITTHTNVNTLIPFIQAHVVFDEYHEYADMEIFNLLFAELVASKNMRNDYDKRTLLVSATPPYSYIEKVLGLDINNDVIEMPSFNDSNYQIKFIDYDETTIDGNPFFRRFDHKTFVISNTAKMAQLSFLYQKNNENSILFHSKYKRSDKKNIFNKVYNTFKENGTSEYNVLRSGPIIQASLNISCDHMLSEISRPENILQRLGRLDRFGKNLTVNTLEIAITDHIKKGNQYGASARFLEKIHSLQTTKAWYNYLNQRIGNKVFKLTEIYNVYKDFYSSTYKDSEILQDLESAIKSSILQINSKVTEPIKFYKKNTKLKKQRINQNSLRGDNRFVQMALLDVNDYIKPKYINQYAYKIHDNEIDAVDNLSESIALIKDLGLLQFMAQKHINIEPTHPVKGIPEKKMNSRYKTLENYARDAEYPLFLSYIEDDLNKVGGVSIRHNQAIYYAICDQQPIGAISIQLINELNKTDLKR